MVTTTRLPRRHNCEHHVRSSAISKKSPHTARPSQMKGLTLLELMIAMTLGLVIVAAVGWIYVRTTQTYRLQDSAARLQEGARYAFELISNDLRMAGSAGCSYQTSADVLNTTVWYKNLF